MILDLRENALRYRGLGRRMALALEALAGPDLLRRDLGRYELDGDRVLAIVQEYATKPRSAGRWEAHRRYIDVQYVVSGTELVGWSSLRQLKISQPYSAEQDVMFLEGEGQFFRLDAGRFAIFYPDDAHMPSLAADHAQQVRKIVLKVAAD